MRSDFIKLTLTSILLDEGVEQATETVGWMDLEGNELNDAIGTLMKNDVMGSEPEVMIDRLSGARPDHVTSELCSESLLKHTDPVKLFSISTILAISAACSLLCVQTADSQGNPPPEGQVPPAGKTVQLVKDFKLIAKLEGLTNHVYGLSFSSDGKRVAAGDTDGYAAVWTFPEGKLIAEFSAALEEDEDVSIFHAMTLNKDGSLLFVGDTLGRVHIWDVATGKTRKVIRAHGRSVNGVKVWEVNGMTLSPDGQQLGTCGSDGKLRMWSVPDGKPVATLLEHGRSLERVVHAPDGRSMVVGDIDGRFMEIAVKDGKVLTKRPRKRDIKSLSGLEIDPAGEFVVSNHYRGQTRVFRRPGLEPLRSFGPPTIEDGKYLGNGVALHPGGQLLAAAYRSPSFGGQGLVALWDVTTGEELKRFEVFQYVVDDVRFSPDGRYLVATGADTWVAVFGREE